MFKMFVISSKHRKRLIFNYVHSWNVPLYLIGVADIGLLILV